MGLISSPSSSGGGGGGTTTSPNMNGNQKNTLKFINTPKNQYAPHGNGYALYSLSLLHIHTTTTTTSSCSYLWSPSREEYIPQNVHSLSSLYVSSNNNKIWTASKTTGKMYCVDPTVRKVVGCWSIPSLCDDGGAIMNRDGFYGNGSLICGVDLDLVMEDDQEEEDGVVNEFEKKSREEEKVVGGKEKEKEKHKGEEEVEKKEKDESEKKKDGAKDNGDMMVVKEDEREKNNDQGEEKKENDDKKDTNHDGDNDSHNSSTSSKSTNKSTHAATTKDAAPKKSPFTAPTILLPNNKPIFCIHKQATSWGIHLYQTPTTRTRFGTKPLECSSCPDDVIAVPSSGQDEKDIHDKGDGNGIGWSTSFPLPDISSNNPVFTTGISVVRVPSSRMMSSSTLKKMMTYHQTTKHKFQKKHSDDNDAMLVVITMTNLGDLYVHTLLECDRNQPRLSNVKAFDGLSVGTTALAVPKSTMDNDEKEKEEEQNLPLSRQQKQSFTKLSKRKHSSSPFDLHITLSNDFPIPSHAITPSTVASRDDCRLFTSIPLDHIPNFHFSDKTSSWTTAEDKERKEEETLETFEHKIVGKKKGKGDGNDAMLHGVKKEDGENEDNHNKSNQEVITPDVATIDKIRVGVVNHEKGNRNILDDDIDKQHQFIKNDQGGTLLQQHQQQQGTPFFSEPMEMTSIYHPTSDMGLGRIQPFMEHGDALHQPLSSRKHQEEYQHQFNIRPIPLQIPSNYTTIHRPKIRMTDYINAPGPLSSSLKEKQKDDEDSSTSSSSSTGRKSGKSSKTSATSRTSRRSNADKEKKGGKKNLTRTDMNEHTVLELENLWDGIKMKKEDDSSESSDSSGEEENGHENKEDASLV
mmetsp:Transcript_36754/g.54930  ORF Transcript_36754/g.54930 Transcript_36754/m.54930 type:complete len:859 (+) Transcript_36754:2394-4970(+)